MAGFDPTPAPGLEGLAAYGVPAPAAPPDLTLDGNEGMVPPAELLRQLAAGDPELLRRYPSTRRLEERLAAHHGLAPERVIVTAGADEALDRLCRALLAPGRQIVLPTPTFVMLPHYVALAGGEVLAVPWEAGPYPVEEVAARVGPKTAVVAFVSPNNPTGAAGSREALLRLAQAVPHALLLVDHAYVEFADEDLTATALSLENALVLRTFSKALGLAGLRVGYALGPERVIGWMRAAGGPYPVSSLSLRVVAAALEADPEPARAFVDQIRRERRDLEELIAALGGEPVPSQANFVCARFEDERWVHEGLAGLGIAVRRFPGLAGLEGKLRITCPGDAADYARLAHALGTVLEPQALLVTDRLERFLDRSSLAPLVSCTVCLEDGPSKPDPAPVVLALERLGVDRAWMIGDTPHDIRAARGARVLPLGLLAPGTPGDTAEETRRALLAAGAARVLAGIEDLEDLLP